MKLDSILLLGNGFFPNCMVGCIIAVITLLLKLEFPSSESVGTRIFFFS